MRFLEPFGDEINPYTGYPFRKENLDERIARILGDDTDETHAVPQPSVQPIKINIAPLNRSIDAVKESSVIRRKETPDTRSVVPSSIQKNTRDRYEIFKVQPIQPYKMDSVSHNHSLDPIKESPVIYGKDTKHERIPPSNQNNAKDKYQIQPIKMEDTVLSNRSKDAAKESHEIHNKETKDKRSFSQSSIQNNTKDRYEMFKSQPNKMDTISLNRSIDPVKKSPILPKKDTKDDERQIMPPPAKRIKLEYKHSFSFIRANSDMGDNVTEPEKKRHRAIFRHFEDWMKIEERNKAYQKVSDISKILWPNPRKVTKDEKVTALNVNEFKKDDVYRMMVDLALNDPNLFEAHELIYAKKRKPSVSVRKQ